MGVKEQLHEAIDRLPEVELGTALRFLEYLRDQGTDPFVAALIGAPNDDEETTPDDNEQADLAWDEHLRGKGQPWEDLSKELESN